MNNIYLDLDMNKSEFVRVLRQAYRQSPRVAQVSWHHGNTVSWLHSVSPAGNLTFDLEASRLAGRCNANMLTGLRKQDLVASDTFDGYSWLTS